jgi:hypothetical protein
MPISVSYDPAASSANNLAINYDAVDPPARTAIQQVVDHANTGQNDRLSKPWGLYSIGRLQSARKGQIQKSGFSVVLEWQPGPLRRRVSRDTPSTSLSIPQTFENMARLSLASQSTGAARGLPME